MRFASPHPAMMRFEVTPSRDHELHDGIGTLLRLWFDVPAPAK